MTTSSAQTYRGPALSSPIPELTVPRFIRQQTQLWPDAVALVEAASGRELTYAALDRMIGRIAAGLSAHGFKAGDTLLMYAPNLPEWPVMALGAMAAGGVMSGANPGYGVADLAHQMRDAGSRFVCTVPSLLAAVREAAALAGCEHIVLIGGDAPGTIGWDSLLACTGPEPEVPNDPDAIAAVPYSSGTTGLAKGVLLTHRTIVANVWQCNQTDADQAIGVALAFLPMFHIFGLTVVTLCGLARGNKLVTLPRFEPESFLQAIVKYRVNRLAVVPPVLQFLATHPLVDQYDLSSIESIGCGGAPLGADLQQKAATRLKCAVFQGFGMTESSGVVAACDPRHQRIGASGRLLPGTEARIVDPVSGGNMPAGEAGELWFHGPQAFKGYLNQPEPTRATITRDGWVQTGDIGFIDADGYLFITDRLKELIKVKGFQVAPAELEALLATHPAVADVTVIGRLDERAGEVPVAYVVPRGALEIGALKAWLAERVVPYKQLADVVICEAIPKSPSGKILRRIVRQMDAQRAMP